MRRPILNGFVGVNGNALWLETSHSYRDNDPVVLARPDLFTSDGAEALVSFETLLTGLANASTEEPTSVGSMAIQVLGDSTGNDTTEWPYLLAQSLATKYPAWTVVHRVWSDTTQDYALPTVIQTGTAGERYLNGGTGTKTRRMQPSVSPNVTGPLDVRVKASLLDWTPAANVFLCGRSAAVNGQRGWYFGVSTAGYLMLVSSTDGTALVTTYSTANVAAYAAGSANWVRFTYTPDNGASGYAVNFYTSADGITWSALGTTVTAAGPRTLFNSTTFGYEIGGISATLTTGIKVYEAQFRDGINGPLVAPALPDMYGPMDVDVAPIAGAPVLTIVNGSHPGANIAYLGDSTRLPLLTPDYGQVVVFLSDSHNEGYTVGTYWSTMFDTWLDAVLVALKRPVPPVILTQNPQATGASWWREHAHRRMTLISYARQNRYDCIDTFGALEQAGAPTSLMLDTIHPNAAGQLVWSDAIKAQMQI